MNVLAFLPDWGFLIAAISFALLRIPSIVRIECGHCKTMTFHLQNELRCHFQTKTN